jgi:hypothetical protein
MYNRNFTYICRIVYIPHYVFLHIYVFLNSSTGATSVASCSSTSRTSSRTSWASTRRSDTFGASSAVETLPSGIDFTKLRFGRKVFECFFPKNYHPKSWRDSISRPIASVSSVAGGEDTTRPLRQGRIFFLCWTDNISSHNYWWKLI